MHYVAMSGDHGCLPDFCTASPTKKVTVEIMADLFDLGPARTRRLARRNYLALDPGQDGASYIEISKCNCGNLSCHEVI